MNVLIIEDEKPAVDKLKHYLSKLNHSITVMDTLSSVKESVEWLRVANEMPDLLFVDVQLTDGMSFEIFSQLQISVPVIFTTAYDEFAIDAFRLHSIDYLLKPITFTDLSRALRKFEVMKDWTSAQNIGGALRDIGQNVYKDRFMVKQGQHIQSVETGKISLFYADGRVVYLVKNDSKKFIIDYRMEDLESLLNPKTFFRVNRTYLLNIDAVGDAVAYTNSRLKVIASVLPDTEIVVSREKVSDFKNWLEGL